MPQSHLFRFCKGDILAAGFVFIVALLLLAGFWIHYHQADAITTQIYLDGKLVHEMPLNENGTYIVSGIYDNTITVQNGKIAVTTTNCPGTDCQRTGWIQTAGQSIVCLPNHMEIRISGEAVIDAVVE